MLYRKFGKLDWNASVLGFGAMRLPTLPDKSVDDNEAIRIIRHAIDRGVNYVDTAYVYHGGRSEVVVGKALRDGYREKVKIATKSPIWELKVPEDFDRLLAEQMARLAVDHVDFYLLHGLGTWGWGRVRELGIIERAEAARADGRIGHLGFSFHDKYDSFKQIVDGYDGWEFCMIQYNYMDTQNQAGEKGLRYAASKGIPVIAMEPVLGGRLANPPVPIRKLFDAYSTERTPTDWALRWLWNRPEFVVVLSGMSSMDQLEANLRAADSAASGVMTPEEFAVIEEVRSQFEARTIVPCTKCDYCLPCPHGVEISRVFDLYNSGVMYEDAKGSRYVYATFLAEAGRADKCTACKECEAKCPQEIAVATWMPKVHAVLGKGEPY